MSNKETTYPGSMTFRVSYKDGKTQEYQSSEYTTVEDFVRSTFGDVNLKENGVKVELVQVTKPAAKPGTPQAKPAGATKGIEKQLEDAQAAAAKEADGQAAPKPE